ncbi:cell division protein FtsB [Thioalkalivibrio sp. XN279]|uniref:cell division protein FtsB n=1 Tax=Thioalkalivibrio sp. XN279 TaxID=2714953 RepID=UPI00140D191E|nr:cell division protein FtsB [Thioalkalivibrio sp. XN279]
MRAVILILAALLLLLQVRLWVSDGGYRAAWRLDEQVAAQEVENAALRERNRALAAEVSDLKTGLDAVQEIARSELGMIREGETLFQVVELEEASLDAVSGGR